jgi:hypothetical protein
MTDPRPVTAAWASCLGIIAIVFGILLVAAHGNELLKQVVITADSAAAYDLPLRCPVDELTEEGISLAECEMMGANVKSMIISRPDWFRTFQIGLMTVGTIVAFGSIFVGIALVDYRNWAPKAAIISFSALAAIDIIGFIAVVNTGPLMRQLYLWEIFLWITIHLMMSAGAFAGRRSKSIEAPLAG